MTGNQIKGKGFRGALRYNLEKVNNKVAEVLDHSFARVSESSILKEVQFVRMQRPNLQKYFYHTSINFPPTEDLPNELMKQIGHDYLEANGFTQHQFIMFRHYDADHPHLHILVNRIGYDGKVLSDSNDFQRSENILRDLEVRYNLTRVTPSKEAKIRAITKNEREMMKRTKESSQKLRLQRIIKSVLVDKPGMTTGEFIRALESKGVRVLFNQATTGFVSGISYDYKGFPIKGGKLGNDFKWSSIKSAINYEQERDQTIIHETNLRTKANRPSAGMDPNNHQRDRNTTREGTERSKPLFSTPDTASLLDDLTHGNNRSVDYEYYLATDNLGRQRKKKKRKGRRL